MSDNPRDRLFGKIRETKRVAGPAKGDGSLRVDDSDAFPLLTSLLAELPPGAAKGAKNGRVAFFLREGKLTAVLTVPSMTAVAFWTLDGFSDALSRLEGALAEGKLEWREDKPNGRK